MGKSAREIADAVIERIKASMDNTDQFTPEEKLSAFVNANNKCVCCQKSLNITLNGRNAGEGCWEAHHDRVSGEPHTPIILCANEPDSCHLECGHLGDYGNTGIFPKPPCKAR
jgi:hypothetical protein